MRKIFLGFSLVFFSLPLLLAFRVASSAKREFSIMSYNVRNAIGMDNQRDYDRIASVIKQASPDIIAIQELDSATGRSKGADVLKEIADRSGYRYLYAPAIVYDGGRYGIGLLCRGQPLHAYYVPLPGREEQRVLQVVEFERFLIFNVHLSLTEEDRLGSVAIINAEMHKYKKPVFLAGDFNAAPGSPEIMALKAQWKQLSNTQPSFPADKPDSCIDYIFSSAPQRILQSAVIDAPMASDHRPVKVTIRRSFPQ